MPTFEELDGLDFQMLRALATNLLGSATVQLDYILDCFPAPANIQHAVIVLIQTRLRELADEEILDTRRAVEFSSKDLERRKQLTREPERPYDPESEDLKRNYHTQPMTKTKYLQSIGATVHISVPKWRMYLKQMPLPDNATARGSAASSSSQPYSVPVTGGHLTAILERPIPGGRLPAVPEENPQGGHQPAIHEEDTSTGGHLSAAIDQAPKGGHLSAMPDQPPPETPEEVLHYHRGCRYGSTIKKW